MIHVLAGLALALLCGTAAIALILGAFAGCFLLVRHFEDTP